MLERYFIADLADLIYQALTTEVRMSSDPDSSLKCLFLSSNGDLINVDYDHAKIYKTGIF